MISATCTWGEGPDVLIVLEKEEYGFMLYEDPKYLNKTKHGLCGNGSLDLTAEEAHKLAYQLHEAAERADRLERGCAQTNQQTDDQGVKDE